MHTTASMLISKLIWTAVSDDELQTASDAHARLYGFSVNTKYETDTQTHTAITHQKPQIHPNICPLGRREKCSWPDSILQREVMSAKDSGLVLTAAHTFPRQRKVGNRIGNPESETISRIGNQPNRKTLETSHKTRTLVSDSGFLIRDFGFRFGIPPTAEGGLHLA